jgi:hypothetical protein
VGNPEKNKAERSFEEMIRDEVDEALGAFRASGFERQIRARIGTEKSPAGRPARARVLAWAGLALVFVSVVSISVWLRSRIPGGGSALAAIEDALAKSPYLRAAAARPARGVEDALPGSLREAIETGLDRALRQGPPRPERVRQPLAFKPVSSDDLDRKIEILFQGRKLELFFSEYLKHEEDV